MAKGIKGIIVEIGGDTSGLKKALSEVNSATSSLSKELRGVNSLLKLDPKNTELLSQKQAILNENIDQTKNKLQQLKDIEAKATEKGINKNKEQQENWRALQREIINTQNKLNKLLLEQNGWNESGKKLEEFGKKIESAGKRIDNIGGKLTKTVTPAILTIGAVSGKSAIDFESAFTGVEKTVDGTAEQMENLKQGIKDMAKEIPASTTEISAVAEAAGQLGIKTEDILSFTRVMIDLGNSTNLSAEEAASSLAKFANVTKMSSKDYDKLGAVIVALGNNFATTEKDIVEMGTRLAATGELTGLSQTQIMALATAMSSVGLEAEAGGSAMSKLLKRIQLAVETGSDDLKDLSKVANMSSKEFKKSFEKDSVKALTAFISGLNDTERNGKSAIAILDDMGITEVRMSNTILSLANASDVMNNAVELGNKAWGDNNALTNEANKRYATTESKLKTTANKAKNLGITLGSKLLPSFNRILDKVDKWINKLEKMDDTTLNNIIKLGLFVTATGPVIKIFGKLTSAVGAGVKTFGIFKQAIGVVNTGAKSTNSTVNLLAGGITKLTSPIGLATLGIGYLATAWELATRKAKEQTKEVKELTSSINDEINTRMSAIKSTNDSMNTNLSEIDNIKRLKDELSNLVDENGNVKKGYESRTDFILNELNKALCTEYERTGDVINGYKDLGKTIDDIIAKKRAQIVLEADEEKYKSAIQNKDKANKTYLDIQDKILAKQKEINEFKQMHKYAMNISDISNYKELQKQLDELNKSLGNSQNEINEYNNTIARYEKNSELVIKGGLENYQKVYKSIEQTESNTTKTQEKEMAKRILNLQNKAKESKRLYDLEAENNKNAKDNIYKTNVEESQKNLQLAVQELISMTNTTGEMSPDVIQAWKNLAQNSRIEYDKIIEKMPADMQDKINRIVGIVNTDTSVSSSVSSLGNQALSALRKDNEFEETGKNWIRGINRGINNKLLRQEALSSMRGFGVDGLQAVQKTWDEHSPSKETEKLAVNFLKGVPIGIKKEAPRTLNAIEDVAQRLLDRFNFTNMSNISNIPNLQSNLTQKINASIKPNIITPNITINTQQLTATEMNRIIDTINVRFGKMY